ncbi:MAG: HAD family hydrolase [Cytophaga sp.]|uniref:HAD family hydrolase n=1 Tax=Cytophaga sp. TaxID=29535 RepID=UPI003F7E32CE
MKDFSNIKNIILDLGAVIIPIDFSLTFQAFASLSGLSIQEIEQRYKSSNLFIDFEKGIIGNYQFLCGVRVLLNLPSSISDQQITDAWNALLLPIPMDHIKRIQELASTYRLFLLSNTNPIHIAEVQAILYKYTQVSRLEKLFEKVWYSYDLGLIKPGVDIYKTVLMQKQLTEQETVFLDDNADNVAGAKQAGIHALLVDEQSTLIELMKHA